MLNSVQKHINNCRITIWKERSRKQS